MEYKRKSTVEELEARMKPLHWTIEVDDYVLAQQAHGDGNYERFIKKQAAVAFAEELLRIGAIVVDERRQPGTPMTRFHFEMCAILPNPFTEREMKKRLDDDLAQLDGPAAMDATVMTELMADIRKPHEPLNDAERLARALLEEVTDRLTASEVTLRQRAKDREVAAAGQRLLKEASEKFPPSTKLAPYKP